jgi:23S rRNA (guanosine2251-2'-O)-methyltransferase
VVGRNPVLEALQAGLPVRTAYVIEGAQRDDRLRDIFQLTAASGLALLEVSRRELDRLTDGAVHQGVALRLPAFDYAHPDDVLADALAGAGLVVACDQITDPHNLGAIVRSAAAFGAVGVIIPERRSAQLTAAAWKASAGAAAHIPVAKATNLNRCLTEAAAAGCLVLGLAGEAETDLAELAESQDLSGPIVLVVGSEGAGLSHLVRQHCDVLVRIPLAGPVESLNASVAAGVALYELAGRH